MTNSKELDQLSNDVDAAMRRYLDAAAAELSSSPKGPSGPAVERLAIMVNSVNARFLKQALLTAWRFGELQAVDAKQRGGP
jgi:hypothetical protein